jgi:signal peptidase
VIAPAVRPAAATAPDEPATRRERNARRRASTRGGLSHAIRVGLTAGALSLVVLVAALAVVVPRITGAQTFTVLTRSMEPTYPPGTLVVVRHVEPQDVRVGDVITFQVRSGNATVVTHRVTGATLSSDGEYSFITTGDNNATADEDAVQAEQIRGTVWYAIPWLGHLTGLRGSGGLATLVPIAGLALILSGGYLVNAWGIERARRT